MLKSSSTHFQRKIPVPKDYYGNGEWEKHGSYLFRTNPFLGHPTVHATQEPFESSTSTSIHCVSQHMHPFGESNTFAKFP